MSNPGSKMKTPSRSAVHCSQDLSGLHNGDIFSPSWPAPYAMDANCLYTLSVEDHLQVELNFSQAFDVEQSTDGHCIDVLMVKLPPFIVLFVQSADFTLSLVTLPVHLYYTDISIKAVINPVIPL